MKNQAKVLLKNLLKIQAIFGIVVYLWLTLTPFLNSIFIHAEEIYNTSEYVFSKSFKDSNEFVTFPLKYFKKIPSSSIDYSVMEKSKKDQMLSN